jgi:hypothetical protein
MYTETGSIRWNERSVKDKWVDVLIMIPKPAIAN